MNHVPVLAVLLATFCPPLYSTWTPCLDGLATYSDGGFGDFPAPKGGLRTSWTTCRLDESTGVPAVIAGALQLYAYSADVLRLTPNAATSSTPELSVTHCDGMTHQLLEEYPDWAHPYFTSSVQFGEGREDHNGCIKGPVEPATWGRLKLLYGREH